MTVQARFVFDSYVFDLLSHGWHIKKEFAPPETRYQPVIASGMLAADYAGGELVEEFVTDVSFSLPLLYAGDGPQVARRALESFLRRGVATKRLTLQLRTDRAFAMAPLWGQWGAWETYEIIHAGSLISDMRVWDGDERDYTHVMLPLDCKPAVTGQPQQVGNARGSVAESFGDDGLSQGTTIATSSLLLLPETAVNESGGMVVVAWESGDDPGGINDLVIFRNAGVGIWWDAINRWWEAYANSTSQHGSATTFPAAGTLCVFHLDYTVGTGTAAAYLNGVKFATLTSVAFTASETYIGTNAGGGAPIGGVFKFLATYDTAMSAAEVAADYADIVATLAGGPSPSPIPYMITLDGDGVLDNATDASGSTDAPHQNYGWIAGVTGTLPAKMELRLFPSVLGSACKRLAVSLLDYDDVFALETSSAMYYDASGTANAASSGGAYLSTTIDTTFTLQINTTQPAAVYQQLQGRELAVYMRAQSGSTGAFQSKLALVVGDTIVSAAKNHVTATGFRMLRTPFLSMPRQSAAEIADAAESFTQLYAGRSIGSGTALIDYGVVMPRPLVEIDTSGMGALGVAIYEATANRYSGTGIVWASLPRIGDVLRPRPHRYNCLTLVMGDETVDPLISWYALTEITITPRWSII